MDIIKHNGQWGVQDWADGYRPAPTKRNGYNPKAKLTWQDAIEGDPKEVYQEARTLGYWKLATKIMNELINRRCNHDHTC